MSDKAGFYSVIQFSPKPSSFEFVNVGVVLAGRDDGQIRVLMAHSAHRVKKLFDGQNAADFAAMAAAFERRLQLEFAQAPSLAHLKAFADSRANLFRILPFRPMLIDDYDADARRLFADLVGEEPRSRAASAKRKLADVFRQQGVDGFVERNPEPVVLPGLRQPIRADYGYQNGHYNLIEAVSIHAKQELNAVRRISGDAQLLKHHSDKRLVVVADVPSHSGDLLDMIRRNLDASEGRVYALAEVAPLVADIRLQGELHPAVERLI